MKIGIDLDGVVLDSETLFRTYEEIYDIEVLKGNNLIDRQEPKYQERYNWNETQKKEFIQKYYLEVAHQSQFMPGFKVIYEKLRKQGHEFVVITARGGHIKEMRDIAEEFFKENNIEFDKYYWHVEDKTSICKQERIELMIDDDWRIVEDLTANGIDALYFRDTNLVKLPENVLLKEVNNWGDIYRYFCENN